ncbi:NADH-quinone oxidoreductase subunit NuoN [Alkalihalobacillus sp. LMS39]|uniref:NADH-quinone oxidoreductase subunit NuoN n=1 Tax=Alkalihalobacillus sp. LMS39 TaxID=2924032 RepID=UPI001FB39390|nr:NADH-quinone oxidoreductase subunit NuoN [Alkalihalobacillus sp. LMS39]UOE93926.1 NADH-quinone oxidoreductase subunit NuoN [Alkalihalobacillus sp. LMS39]
MDLETLLSYPWQIMAPEFTILIVATLLSLLDLFLKDKVDRRYLAWFGLAGILIALFFLINQLGEPVQMILYDTYRLDSFSIAFKLIMLVGAAFVLIMAIDYGKKEIAYRGEFFYLFLTALLGGMIMASSADMITLFVGLELLSLSSYILAGLKKHNVQSNESAFKYVVNGGIATAITLFGMSYVYGLTGYTNLFDIAEAMSSPVVLENQFLAFFAFFLVFVGLVFKIAGVPFHMWAPDVYQGAPTPVSAFLSVVSKTAGFAIILRFMIVVFIAAPGLDPRYSLLFDAQYYIVWIAALTMIIGNVMALRQYNVKRMFAYSSIAQAGYLLVPLATFNVIMFENIWFYLVAYLFMNLGAFAVLQLVTTQAKSEQISSFAGLGKRSPITALFMGLFLLSLAGIPVTAGFIGKYYIFLGAVVQQYYWLVAIMIATSVVSYFYYFRIMGQMYFRPVQQKEPFKVPVGMYVVLILAGVGTLGLGLFPNLALDFFATHFDISQILQR